MTDEEIYLDLVEKTKDVKIEKVKGMYNISELCFLLGTLLVSQETLHQVGFSQHKEEFAQLFEDYYPKKILHNGQYLSQLNRVLDHFKPENPSPYKKVTQAFFLTARYFSRYDSFESFRKEVYLSCTDEKSTLDYLKNFRKTSGLSLAYFGKTCTFFSKSGLLDVPIVSKESKDYFLPLFDIPDENDLLYKRLVSFAKKNHISCHELNRRIETLHA